MCEEREETTNKLAMATGEGSQVIDVWNFNFEHEMNNIAFYTKQFPFVFIVCFLMHLLLFCTILMSCPQHQPTASKQTKPYWQTNRT